MSTAYLSSPISPITSGLGHLALFENTDDLNANSRPRSGSEVNHVVETQPMGESWESWGDGDIWRTIQSMLATLSSNQDQKPNPNRNGEVLLPKVRILLNPSVFEHPRASNNGDLPTIDAMVMPKCATESSLSCFLASIPLIKSGSFIPLVPITLQGMVYWLDSQGDLCYQLVLDWVKEVFYTELKHALFEVMRCIENNNLQGTTKALWIHTTSSEDSLGGTSSGPSSPTLSIGSDEGHALPQLSERPDRSEIDNWFQQLKRCRAIQAKAGHRLQEVRCPLRNCAKVQRRPQALRDHLYFHYGIKPYKCQFGCQQAFETKANMERHTDTCPIRWGTQ
ncbi:unnamed protein product [Rhizoctonia solani]|uniref:C2H2-type domain-containing protein n=1 Tax=Rhizoctonia solani TaxID=456999 RepID=A0A8H3D2F5_9AGAM|nr:unnamed protein product [Rhizoctonia solani]